MQTPLQELIEWNEKELLEAKHVIDNAKDYDGRTLAMADHYYRVHYQVKAKATELLEKEMDVIERFGTRCIEIAISNCSYDSVDGYVECDYSMANKEMSDYYTKTFTNESK